jgi:probable rRNA maturation factor
MTKAVKSMIFYDVRCKDFKKTFATQKLVDNFFELCINNLKLLNYNVPSEGLINYCKDPFNKFKQIVLSISLISNEQIQNLNLTHRKINKPTNILSFSTIIEHKNTVDIGDLYIAPKVILKEALEQDKSPQDHYKHIVLHGFLHLLGFDHQSLKDAEVMEELEIKILSQVNVKNPYED